MKLRKSFCWILLLTLGLCRASEATGCYSLGSRSDTVETVSLLTLLTRAPYYDGRRVTTNGVLRTGFEADALCLSRESTSFESAGMCLDLTIDWKALGQRERDVRRVLAQWAGKFVEVEGLFSKRGKPLYAGSVSELSAVRTTGGAQKEYCLDYRGPLLPSGLEDSGAPRETSAPNCRDTTQTLVPSTSKAVCLDRTEALVWVGIPELTDGGVQIDQWESVRFQLETPYSGRDILMFKAFDETTFLFVLSDGRLYSWNSGQLREVESAEVDMLKGQPSRAYYRAFSLDREGRIEWNALRWITEDLKPATIWESAGARLERFYPSGEGVTFFVLEGDEEKRFRYEMRAKGRD